jgi:hypothetical protein
MNCPRQNAVVSTEPIKSRIVGKPEVMVRLDLLA